MDLTAYRLAHRYLSEVVSLTPVVDKPTAAQLAFHTALYFLENEIKKRTPVSVRADSPCPCAGCGDDDYVCNNSESF
jgi:hypothetical protein